MSESEEHWSSRFRLVLILIMLLIGIAVTMVSTILVTEVDKSWTAGSMVRGVLSAVLVLFSGIYVNLMLAGIVKVWRNPESADRSVSRTIKDIRALLGQTPKRVGILLTVAAIVATGVALRPSPPPDTNLEAGELVIMTAFDESPSDPRTMLIEQWDQSHPGIHVKVVSVPGEPDQQYSRMVNDAKPGGVHEADVYLLDIVWMEQFKQERYIRELDRSRLTGLGDFVPKVLGTCSDGEKLWCLPLNTDFGLMYYRTDVEGVVQPPTTWDQYFGADAAAVAAQSPAVNAANAAALKDEEILTVVALEAMWAAEGKTFDAKGHVAQNEDKTSVQLGPGDERGLKRLVDAARNDDIVITSKVRSATDDSAVEDFASGGTMYMRNWPVVHDRLVGKVKFGVAAPPTPSVLGGQNLAIRADTGKPRAAQSLIEFLTSATSQLLLSEMGGFAPTRTSAYENAERRDMSALRTALSEARLRPMIPRYVEFSRVFRLGVAEAITDGSGRLKPETLQELSKILNGPGTVPTS
jgi:multiple sugar transport system substrate-binding protein